MQNTESLITLNKLIAEQRNPSSPPLTTLMEHALQKSGSCLINCDSTIWIFCDPVASITFNGQTALLSTQSVTTTINLEHYLNAFWNISTEYPMPLAAGFFSYEYLHQIENIHPYHPNTLPLAFFQLFNTIYCIQGNQQRTYSLSWSFDNHVLEPHLSTGRENSTNRHQLVPFNFNNLNIEDHSNFSQASYCAAVERIKDAILDGNVYQVNLSQQIKVPLQQSASELINKFLKLQPPQRRAIVKGPDFALLSLSPELFFSSDSNEILCKPIKGTRPRSSNPEQDHHYLKELLNSPKERAELAMIVDLVRNDLGRLCQAGSIVVTEFPAIAKLPHLFHTFATIKGAPNKDLHFMQLLHALFPCGSITGAPKVAAMQYIAELEGTARGPYCGAIGFIGSQKFAHFNVAIRTALVAENTFTFSSGGGVTIDSDPLSEYNETLIKLQALLKLFD